MSISNNKIFGLLRTLFYYWRNIPRFKKQQKKIINTIKEKECANVVFFAASLPMWKYQGVYDLMRNDKRFKTTIIITPIRSYSDEQNAENITKLKEYFNSRNITFEDSTQWSEEQYNIREWLKPDIMFYTQQYGRVYGNSLDSDYFQDKLLVLVPYGIFSFRENWELNTHFQNIAWKLYYDTEICRDISQKIMYNHGSNIVVVGNTDADEFFKTDHKDNWKPQSMPKKRIIWAPHFTITQDQLLNRGSFIWLCDFMLTIAKEYEDELQIAFKPHPRLRSMLYQHPEWGQNKTDEYYEKWKTMANTQLEDSSFADLFMTSDAMIHDCGSFTIEYHYSKNPCLFTTHNVNEVREPLNELGRDALNAHYIGKNINDISSFINNVVLGGKDPMKREREAFFNKYLLPPKGQSVAQNIYNDIINTIWGYDRKFAK